MLIHWFSFRFNYCVVDFCGYLCVVMSGMMLGKIDTIDPKNEKSYISALLVSTSILPDRWATLPRIATTTTNYYLLLTTVEGYTVE